MVFGSGNGEVCSYSLRCHPTASLRLPQMALPAVLPTCTWFPCARCVPTKKSNSSGCARAGQEPSPHPCLRSMNTEEFPSGLPSSDDVQSLPLLAHAPEQPSLSPHAAQRDTADCSDLSFTRAPRAPLQLPPQQQCPHVVACLESRGIGLNPY